MGTFFYSKPHGHVRVFDLVGTTWTQVDDDIDGEETNDLFGQSVGISAS